MGLSSSQRRKFEADVLKALRTTLKGTLWKKSSYAVFGQTEGRFFSASFNVWLNQDKTVWQFEAKPMSVDPIFWSIMDMVENEEEPLSLRALGSFVCSALPVATAEVKTSDYSEERMASDFVGWIRDRARAFLEGDAQHAFSNLVERHDNYRERGAYAATLICSLLDEDRVDRAVEVAKSIVEGERSTSHTQTTNGRSFYELALERAKNGWRSE